MSPLRYQKVLRLHEARRVGYLSASHFSREYSQFFGNTPSKDIALLRDEGLGRSDGDR